MNKIDFIFEDLLNKIIKKEYKQDEKLPTERDLTIHYNVSRHTVREALSRLSKINCIYKVQGSGNFVNSLEHINTLLYNSLTNKKFKEIRSIVTDFKKKSATSEQANILGIKENEDILEFIRIRIADYKNIQIEHTIVPFKLFPNLKKEILENSFHNYVISIGYKISHTLTEYSAVNLTKKEAELLSCKSGIAAIKIKNRGYLTNNEIFEYTESINLDYKCSYITHYDYKTHNFRKQNQQRGDS